jgi:DNA-binding GntR family transcriptional regulator
MVDLVLEEIRGEIVSGVLAGGAELSITALSSRFEISHTPVREALQRLEGEGLVQLRRARRAIVAPVSVSDLRQLYRLRASIEGDLALLAAGHHTVEQLDRLSVLLDELEFTDGLRDGAHFEFHSLLLAPAASTWDWRVLDVVWRASERYLALVIRKARMKEGVSGLRNRHVPMFEAASAGDPELLQREVLKHLGSSAVVLSGFLGESLAEEPASNARTDLRK